MENLILSIPHSLIYSRVLQIVSRMLRSSDAGEAAQAILFILCWTFTLGLPRDHFTLLIQNYWGCTELLSFIITQQVQ